MVKEYRRDCAREGVPSSAIDIHFRVGDDRNDAVVVRIVLSKDEILGLFAGKLHFQLKVGTSAEKNEERATSNAEAVRMGAELDEGTLPAGRKAEVRKRGSGN